MRGIEVTEFGGPEVLRYSTDLAPPPKPTGNQVLVRVKSIGVNPVDTYIRSGSFVEWLSSLPYVPGFDGAGTVEETGELVTKFKKGDRVFWTLSVTGSYAELVLTSESRTFHLHDARSFAEGAAIGVPYCTAYKALVTKARLKPGQTVFIHGASGGVGLACCQIARALGAFVVGTAGTEDGLKLVLSNGSHLAFNHKQNGYLDQVKGIGRTVDVIVEMLTNVNLQNDFHLIRPGGQIIMVGNRGEVLINPGRTLAKEISLHGVSIFLTTEAEFAEMGEYFSVGQEHGWLRPVLEKEFPLNEAERAHAEVIERKEGSRGKILLTV